MIAKAPRTDLVVPTCPTEPVPRIALTPAETAQALGRSERTVMSWIADGTIPSFKLGNSRLVPVDALRAWAATMAAGQ
jgi:excisionase family DNA binding protein